MATQTAVIEKVKEDLNCLVCLDAYSDPKQLQCHHVFCRGCLEGLVKQNQQGQSFVSCPTCRKDTPVPAEGVASISSAFRVNKLQRHP